MSADNDQLECETPKGNVLHKIHNGVYGWLERPVVWFRKTIVEPNQKPSNWYHMELRRVPTIDQCYTDDFACMYEADQQYKRDRAVDSEILSILRYRMDDCVREEHPDIEQCFPLKEAYEQAAENWFIRYGDLGAIHHVKDAYMKQKHRMLWERRHGKVGTGMKISEYAADVEDH